MCGILARVDTARGVWKAPANETVIGAVDLQAAIDIHGQERLSAQCLNSIRSFPSRGILLWGARTTSSDPADHHELSAEQLRSGALIGTKPEDAFFVRCDSSTMTQDDIDDGRLIAEIGVAPVRPAEFVIIRIGLWTASRCATC